MAKNQLGLGNIKIELGEETLELRPSLKAAQILSRGSGGLIAAIRAVGEMDMDLIVRVIATGANMSDADAKKLPDKVWNVGLSELVGPVTKYLSFLANGGRPIQPEDEEKEGDDPLGKSSD